ncbi:MAG: C40 family peptidase [Eubacterium sp.]|nr:C40 family peptidase [Candidatus Colimonas fimequi]
MKSINSVIKRHKRLFSVALAVVVAFAASVICLAITSPYAVYADGTKVRNPYAIVAGEKQVALVADEKTAQTVIAEIMDDYTPKGSQINEIVVDEQLSASKASLSRGGQPDIVMTGAEAVNYVETVNKSDDPIFCVTVTSEQGAVESIDREITDEDSDKMYEGETKTKVEGADGDKVVVVQTVSVNGEKVSTQVVDTTIVREAVNSIVYKGTVNRNSYIEGIVLGSGNGKSVASYGMRYIGNPYRYGGTSLTGGIDCSGFTQAIFRAYGVRLPRTSAAQRKVGKGVSYSDAKPGDLICYSGHVAIYIGGGKIVHAATPKRGICVSSAKGPGKILTVRRVIE